MHKSYIKMIKYKHYFHIHLRFLHLKSVYSVDLAPDGDSALC